MVLETLCSRTKDSVLLENSAYSNTIQIQGIGALLSR